MSRSPSSHQPLVFTLDDTQTASSETAHDVADWERNLERLRQSKRPPAASLPIDDIFSHGEAAAAPSAPSRPASAAVAANTDAQALLDPVQRERVYRAYLQQWQHQQSLTQARQEAALNDTTVLLQEDWLAAQECLQSAPAADQAVCVVRLSKQAAQVIPAPAVTDAEAVDVAAGDCDDTAEASAPVLQVHLHVIEPKGAQGRAVTCLSEQALLAGLSEKLRPHLADAVAGMVRVAVQKQTSLLVSQLQQQLLAEVPAIVDDVLQHNLARIMRQLKQQGQ